MLAPIYRDEFSWVSALPPVGLKDLPADGKIKDYEAFARLFSLSKTTTELVNPITANLSEAMKKDVCEGLQMLWEADQAVLKGFGEFVPKIRELAPKWAERLKEGKRVLINGSGSSGRLGLGLAPRCKEVSARFGGQVIGVMAGGDSAMIRAKEGYEDSEPEGENCLKPFGLKKGDISIQVSASGSAFFNVGCGHYAANQGADVYYFYNSKDVPDRTQKLFERVNNPVEKLLVDIGAQSITGSTRLQSASVAELCLGALLICSLLYAEGKEKEADEFLGTLYAKMEKANLRVREQLTNIATFARKEADIFLAPESNFYRQKDEGRSAYVTVLGEKETLRIGMTDMTEVNPTFQINPIRRQSEHRKKKGEYRAYLAGEKDNRAAWEVLVGRPVESQNLADADEFLIAAEAQGNYSYESRPKGPGNFVIGLSKTGTGIVADMLSEVTGDTGLIVVSKEKTDPKVESSTLLLKLDELDGDDYGLVEGLVMKQVLNMISNAAMVLVGKVRGSLMIDMRASNQKLIDRAMRIVTDICGNKLPISDEELYYYVQQFPPEKLQSIDL